MKRVPLGNNQFALVDDEDFWQCCQQSWHVEGGYARGKLRGKHILLHRFIMGVSDPGTKVDHRNRNRLDCQKHNLRIATDSNNAMNRKPSNQYKGVHWVPDRGKWRAMIHKDHIGLFDNAEDAARAYDAEAIKYDGEFAYLNFPKVKDGELAFGVAGRVCPKP